MGLYKNEAIRADSPFRHGPLRQAADVETVTMSYAHWYNEDRLHSLLDYATPTEAEAAFYTHGAISSEGTRTIRGTRSRGHRGRLTRNLVMSPVA